MRTTIIRRMAASIAAVVIALAAVAPAAAWHNYADLPSSIRWPNGNRTYCVFGSPSETHTNSVRAMADRLNGYLGNINLVYNGTGVGGAGCEISLTMGWFGMQVAATTGVQAYAGTIQDADIYVNSSRYAMWQYGATQNCYVGYGQGCLPDFRTIVMHELMHAIGLGHNRGTENANRCVKGFYSTGALSACDFYGEAVMHWEAGIEFENGSAGGGYLHQGYRHEWPSADDVAGLNALY